MPKRKDAKGAPQGNCRECTSPVPGEHRFGFCSSIILSASLILAITRKRASLSKRPEGNAASDSIAPAPRSDVCSLCSSFSCTPAAPPLTHRPQIRNLSSESTASICLAADPTLFTHFDAAHHGAHVRSQMKQRNTLLAWPRRDPTAFHPGLLTAPLFPQTPHGLSAPRSSEPHVAHRVPAESTSELAGTPCWSPAPPESISPHRARGHSDF